MADSKISALPSATVPLAGTEVLPIVQSGATVNVSADGLFTNPTVTNYTEAVVAIGNSSTAQTLDLTNGTFQTCTLTGNCTFTMPTATAGKSFILLLTQDGTGSRTAVFTSVKFSGGTAPTITVTAGKSDILTFLSDGTSWFGSSSQNYSA